MKKNRTVVVGLWYRCVFVVALSLVVVGLKMPLKADDKVQMVFPQVEGKSLQGEVVSFPDVFSKKPFHVAVIAFEQEQQSEVDTWLPSLKELLGQRKDVDYFELPTISRMNAFMRWFIYRGMRSGIKDEGDRARTVTLHISKDPFKSALSIDSEDSIVVLVVDEQGEVISRSQGAFDEAKWKRLLSVLPDSKSK